MRRRFWACFGPFGVVKVAKAVLQAFRQARNRVLCFDNEGTLAADSRPGGRGPEEASKLPGA